MSTLREIGEVETLRRLIAARSGAGGADPASERAPADIAAPSIVVDAGDDAAVLRPRAGFDLVATTDAFVEGRHYDPAWLSSREIGARLAEANLSDLAAMAATPLWALLSLGVRPEREVTDLIEFETGLSEALARAGARLVGGNLAAAAEQEWSSLTLLGEVERGRAWSRHGARAGDLLAVSGRPGRAGAGLAMARRHGQMSQAPVALTLIDAWLRPRARCELARVLAPLAAVTAAIDVSDGVAGDLARLCASSGVGAEVRDADWPDDPELAQAAAELESSVERFRYGPSDDYELMLAIDPGRGDACVAAARAAGVPLTVIGRFTGPPATITLRARDGQARPLAESGFDHFA